MINEINNLINKFFKTNESNFKNKKIKKSSKKADKNKVNSFESLFIEKTLEDVYEKFENFTPEELIDKIIEYGKSFQETRNPDIIEKYKEYLSGFLALTLRNSYKIIKILKKNKSIDNDELNSKLLIIKELRKKYVALTDYLLSTQTGIFKLISDIEGLLLNLKA